MAAKDIPSDLKKQMQRALVKVRKYKIARDLIPYYSSILILWENPVVKLSI
ncbi:hypothetical protein Pmar_PMAR029313 [Perkinsus marinus ATCC 50983]|uniref:Uncharacterized protein n=1 Tax=Perkinsus marinus (strain ATCC 50983 / TXsc) TaxID=423536 RepID=C5KMT8_PERM5|nr:hypothetical protein Pmar_PMAR029313 [Perkinsus marinus ATCC 50983]EER14246.1 hypothetical protein Pmar_PMAR029313 [Perkinsus marinus ATCC 50983]|eukprot:XP_002782451.1 hypothetical protein Pmar_PMAR029313 [Perkinsus marinus ATCC 50983]